VFWNRFPRSLKYARKKHWEKHDQAQRAMQLVREYAEKNPPVLGVACVAQVEVPFKPQGRITTVEIPLGWTNMRTAQADLSGRQKQACRSMCQKPATGF
jgi:hypothetical protein